MKAIHKVFILLSATVLMASCSTDTWKKINYLQDVKKDTTMVAAINRGVIIQPQDMISITVTSRNSDLALAFNKILRSSSGTTGNSNRSNPGYVVDNAGDIDFPQIGVLHVAGLTRWELQDKIKGLLVEGGLLTDANVSVEFMNFKFSVLGEVSRPGTFSVTSDKITIFEALSLAGDLTIHGKRDNIMVMREQNGARDFYYLDIRSSEIFKSPAYFLQQNDVVYVTPSEVRAGQSTINENNFKSVGFWMSASSLLMSVTTFVLTIANNSK